MPLLIDGHNLIGRMSDLSLDDPDDEVKLVQRVRRHCLRHRRQATIIFDAGLPGGPAPHLSAPPVAVVFAAPGVTADHLICQRIRRARDPRGLLVVSSDRVVQEAARSRGGRVIPAEEFAAQLADDQTREPGEQGLSKEQVAEWLELFSRKP